jgi:hypothetical protein
MKRASVPYSVPSKLEADLARVRAYWDGLKRGEAGMPFWDDVDLTALPDLAGRLMLMEVFDKPLAFGLGPWARNLRRTIALTSQANSQTRSRSVVPSITSTLNALPRSRVVRRHTTGMG